MNDTPIDRALELLAAGDAEGSLRWSAALLEMEPTSPVVLVLASRALWRLGHERAAVEGLEAAARRGACVRDVLTSLAAIAELRAGGVDVGVLASEVAREIRGTGDPADTDGELGGCDGPIGPLEAVTPRALAARAAQRIYEVADLPTVVRPIGAFFDALPEAALRDLAMSLRAVALPSGARVIEEARDSNELFFVALGAVAISRYQGARTGDAIAHLARGALLGEVSALWGLPAPADAFTTRPSILLALPRLALYGLEARHPDLRRRFGAYCRSQAARSLGATCSLLSAVPPRERAVLIGHMGARTYQEGERLARAGETPEGLHVLVSGSVALLAGEGRERGVVANLAPGDVLGETEVVLCRSAVTDAIASCPTATLFLPREELLALALDHPALLRGLYAAASRRRADDEATAGEPAAEVLDGELEIEAVVPTSPETPQAPDPFVLEAVIDPPLAAAPEPEPEEAEVARSNDERPAPPSKRSAPPPLRSSTAPPSARLSLAPMTASHPPAPSNGGQGVRRSLAGAALLAVGAGAAALLASGRPTPMAPMGTAAAAAAAPTAVTPSASSPPSHVDVDTAAPATTTTPAPPADEKERVASAGEARHRPAARRSAMVASHDGAGASGDPKVTADAGRAALTGAPTTPDAEFGGRE